MTTLRTIGQAVAVIGALLVPAKAGIAQTQRALPPLTDTMYDKDLPPVVRPEQWPTLCPALPPGRTVQPPTRDGRMECAEHYEAIAEDVFRAYATSSDGQVRARAADVLSQLWLAQRLRSDIKVLIIERDVVPVLVQIPLPDGRLELQVSTRTAFPYPAITFTVRSVVYRNGVALGPPRRSHGRTRLQEARLLTSLGTGRFDAGDVYSFDVIVEEESGGDIVWRKVLRSNAVAVE